MSLEDLIITVYRIEEMYQEAIKGVKLRSRGTAPVLSDTEVLTMLMVGEYLGLGNDKKIWLYFVQHWPSWFPGLGCRSSFVHQGANLLGIVDRMQQNLSEILCNDKGLYLFDGFPIPYASLLTSNSYVNPKHPLQIEHLLP